MIEVFLLPELHCAVPVCFPVLEPGAGKDSEITDRFFCLNGPMVVETRAPRTVNELETGESCTVLPKIAERVHGKDNGPCRYLLLQGVGVYDNIAVGG